jgi:queuosine biosynthesis protein QueC
VYIDYGTKSRVAEMQCAAKTAEQLGLEFRVVEFPFYTKNTKAFILGNSDFAEQGSMFWLEGRNAIICMMMAVLAKEYDANEIYIGINASDSRGDYIDTDARFVASINSTIACSCRHPVKVLAPWVDKQMTKVDVIALGEKYGLDWKLTHSCSNGETAPCCDYYGCESCFYRREEFETLGLKDPWMPTYA